MREFKIGKYKVCIVNRYTGGMEINERNPKYDIRYFSEELGGWVRLASLAHSDITALSSSVNLFHVRQTAGWLCGWTGWGLVT